MRKPRQSIVQEEMTTVIERTLLEMKACEERGDVAGHDAWELALRALQHARECTQDAHDAVSWDMVPEPPILPGSLLVVCDAGYAHAKAGYYDAIEYPVIGWAIAVPEPASGVVSVRTDTGNYIFAVAKP